MRYSLLNTWKVILHCFHIESALITNIFPYLCDEERVLLASFSLFSQIFPLISFVLRVP